MLTASASIKARPVMSVDLNYRPWVMSGFAGKSKLNAAGCWRELKDTYRNRLIVIRHRERNRGGFCSSAIRI